MKQNRLFPFSEEEIPAAPAKDICSSRHGGNAQSEAAFGRVAPTISQAQAEILAWLKEHGPATAKEYAAAVGRQLNALSGRFSELHHKLKLIRPTGEERDGAAVYEVVPSD